MPPAKSSGEETEIVAPKSIFFTKRVKTQAAPGTGFVGEGLTEAGIQIQVNTLGSREAAKLCTRSYLINTFKRLIR
jgi:hypothetical protein